MFNKVDRNIRTKLGHEHESIQMEYISKAYLISWFTPELNVKTEKIGGMSELALIHIQNFCDVSDFLNDYMVYLK